MSANHPAANKHLYVRNRRGGIALLLLHLDPPGHQVGYSRATDLTEHAMEDDRVILPPVIQLFVDEIKIIKVGARDVHSPFDLDTIEVIITHIDDQ